MNIEERIEELLSKMTLHEKVGQLHQVAPSKVGGFEIPEEEAFKLYKSGDMDEKTYDAIINHKMLSNHEDEIRKGEIGSFISVIDAETANHYQKIAVEESRLGIPLIFGLDVIHGFKTMFPIPLAESCSFDDELFEETARVAAKESVAGGVNWTYAPMVDVARDSRWGRVAEGAGEDTYLASRFSRAKVRGFQGKDLTDEDRIAACVKHFAAYGAVEGGCDYDTVDMSMPKFFETYYPPYEAAVKEGCASVMMAFNDLSGVPCTTNEWLIQDLLRKNLGFKGVVISDANAIKECVNHGTALDTEDAVKQSIEAGTEMDLGSDLYETLLEQMVLDGKVEEKYVVITSDDYPDFFHRVDNPPFVFFYEGNLELFDQCDHYFEKTVDGRKCYLAINQKGNDVDWCIVTENEKQLVPEINKFFEDYGDRYNLKNYVKKEELSLS